MDGKLVGGIGKGERKEMWEVVQSCRQGWKRQRQVNSQLSLESLGDKRGGWGEKTMARFPNSLYTRRSGSLTRRIVTLQCIEHIRILTSLMEADASQVSHRCTSCIFLRTAHICLHLPFSSNACSSFVNSFTPATSIFLSSFNYQ